MERLLSNITLAVPEKIYIKDPESSDLGKRIVEHSILLIEELGFDQFTFKKLGARIKSNESSIYRYFESKHKLLLYLSSRYWAWIEYQLVFETHNISKKDLKLKKAIEIVTRSVKEDSNFSHVNEVALNKIIIHENSKLFLTTEVDRENKNGIYSVYKRVLKRLQQLIVEINPEYPFAASLASTIVEGALHQHFLKDHFNTITDCKDEITPTDFFIDLSFKALK